MDEISILSEVRIRKSKGGKCWRNSRGLPAGPYFASAGRRKVFKDTEGAKNYIK